MPIEVLSYGYEKPSDPTFGDVFWPALERNIQQLNDHNHNGTNSAPIASVTASISSGSWGADIGGGTYRQEITLPAGRTYDTTRLFFKRSTGEMTYPTVERASATSFYIYTNDNSVSYVVSYV